ncbi:hypothetical protein D3C84_1195940 [compost metagenome]
MSNLGVSCALLFLLFNSKVNLSVGAFNILDSALACCVAVSALLNAFSFCYRHGDVGG